MAQAMICARGNLTKTCPRLLRLSTTSTGLIRQSPRAHQRLLPATNTIRTLNTQTTKKALSGRPFATASSSITGRSSASPFSERSSLKITPLRRLYATTATSSTTMKALVYKGNGDVQLQDQPKPTLQTSTDAIIRVLKTTICGTDLHIRKGDVATCSPGRVLGHEGVGVVEEAGSAVSKFRKGDRVLISCICSCAACDFCRRGMYSHCTTGGWILGNTIDGTQAEYVRIPHADTSLYNLPSGIDESALVMLSDIFPTGFECGVLNAKVAPGSTVAIVGTGPVGLAALITAQLYSPSQIIAIDMDENRLKIAKALGAHATVNNSKGIDAAVAEVMKLTNGAGCDSVLEVVGVPGSFELCQHLLAVGGTLANVGVHGGSAPLHLESLWDKNISVTTRLVDTVTMPMLLKLVKAKRLDPSLLITHKFKFSEMEKAYDTFGQAAKHSALKVLVEME